MTTTHETYCRLVKEVAWPDLLDGPDQGRIFPRVLSFRVCLVVVAHGGLVALLNQFW